ncbi:hypothetical protein ACFVWN_01800 [Nocardiopsis flavescens]|uniref:SecDF P1 head subdomain-containing protein n=1 Tax=Nocardiopsis flavescens TaxID=758803 RepID=UPI003665AB92
MESQPPHPHPSPPSPEGPPRRNLLWPLVAGAVALTLLVAAGGVTAWLLFIAERPGGGESVEFRLGNGQDPVPAEDVDLVSAVLHRRVVDLAAGEPAITVQGDTALTVEFPPDTDVAEATALLERPGVMAVHPVLGAAVSPDDGDTVLPVPSTSELLRVGPAGLGNAQVASAGFEHNPSYGQWEVQIEFTGEGAGTWATMTGEAACQSPGDPRRRLAIVVDEEIVSAPEVTPDVVCGVGLDVGATVVTGGFERTEAAVLATLVGSDPLPVAVTAVP